MSISASPYAFLPTHLRYWRRTHLLPDRGVPLSVSRRRAVVARSCLPGAADGCPWIGLVGGRPGAWSACSFLAYSFARNGFSGFGISRILAVGAEDRGPRTRVQSSPIRHSAPPASTLSMALLTCCAISSRATLNQGEFRPPLSGRWNGPESTVTLARRRPTTPCRRSRCASPRLYCCSISGQIAVARTSEHRGDAGDLLAGGDRLG